MLNLERKKKILNILEKNKSVSVKELCAALYASPATIRRDLSELEAEGRLRRSFGGAILNESFPDQLPLTLRATEHTAEKKRIAQKALKLVGEGETIFLDGSSTTYFLAERLGGIPDITVITNDPAICISLASKNVRCFCTGGEMLTSSKNLIGSDAEKFIRGIRAHACFFSARGYSDGICTDSSKAERDIKRCMLENSEEHYFLCDTSKLGQRFPYVIASNSEIDAVIDEK